MGTPTKGGVASCHGVARSAKTEMPMLQCLASLFRLRAHALRRDRVPPHHPVGFDLFFRYIHGFGASSLRFLRPHRSFALLTPHRGYFMPPRHTARLTNSACFARSTTFNLSRSENLFMPTRRECIYLQKYIFLKLRIHILTFNSLIQQITSNKK